MRRCDLDLVTRNQGFSGEGLGTKAGEKTGETSLLGRVEAADDRLGDGIDAPGRSIGSIGNDRKQAADGGERLSAIGEGITDGYFFRSLSGFPVVRRLPFADGAQTIDLGDQNENGAIGNLST